MNAAALRAVTIDLDDTLWPVTPALLAAETDLDRWLRRHHPQVATQFPITAMRALREQVAAERPDLAHDFSAQRRLTLAHAFRHSGVDEAPVEAAFEIYYAARNRVTPYADTVDALQRIARRLPLVSLSNGNADLDRIGLGHFFHDHVNARRAGVAKPHADIFALACRRAGAEPQTVLHVGDDPHADVGGARGAGLRTAWVNREGADWEHGPAADLEVRTLTELADWLEDATSGAR